MAACALHDDARLASADPGAATVQVAPGARTLAAGPEADPRQPLAAKPRAAITQAVAAVPAANAEQRVKTAAYLLVTGPQYQVQR